MNTILFLYALFYVNSFIPYDNTTQWVFIYQAPTLQAKKQMYREVILLAQGHITTDWKSEDLNPGNLP